MQTRNGLQRSTTSIRCASIAAISLGLALPGRPARADPAAAEALFDDGNQLMAAGKVAEACAAFEASNRAEPRAGTLIHLGACRERNRQLASAWSAYKDAMARARDPVKRDLAAARIAALEPRLSHLMVSVPGQGRPAGLTITRDGSPLDPALWNRPLPVDGGDHVIAARAPDHVDWQTTVHVDAEGAAVDIAAPRLAPLRTPAMALSGEPAAPPRFTARQKLAIGLVAMTVVGGATGATLGLLSSRNQDEAAARCPPTSCSATQADAANARIRTSYREAYAADVAFGVAALAAVGAGALWFTRAPDRDDAAVVRVVPAVAPAQAGVVVTGRF